MDANEELLARPVSRLALSGTLAALAAGLLWFAFIGAGRLSPDGGPLAGSSSSGLTVPTVSSTEPTNTEDLALAAVEGWQIRELEQRAAPVDGTRSALYADGQGAQLVVSTTGGSFEFSDLEARRFGAEMGWLFEPAEVPGAVFISVSGDEGVTHLRTSGLTSEDAAGIADALFADGFSGFTDELGATDTLPLVLGSLEMIGETQPGFDPVVADRSLVAARSHVEVEIRIFSESEVGAAATEAIRVSDPSEGTAARLAWELGDGRTAVFSSAGLDQQGLVRVATELDDGRL